MPLDKAFAASGPTPATTTRHMWAVVLGHFNIGVTLDVTGKAESKGRVLEQRSRSHMKSMARALNRCKKFKIECSVAIQLMCPSPTPGPHSLNKWFHVPGTYSRWHASIVCRRCPAHGSPSRRFQFPAFGQVGGTTGWAFFGTRRWSIVRRRRRSAGHSQAQRGRIGRCGTSSRWRAYSNYER